MKPTIEQCDTGWKVKPNSTRWLMICQTKEQAKRAVNMFSDSPIDWMSMSIPGHNYQDSQARVRKIIARISVQLAKEFEMELGTLLASRNKQEEIECTERVEYYASLPMEVAE